MCWSHLPNHPFPIVHGKTGLHETGSWHQKRLGTAALECGGAQPVTPWFPVQWCWFQTPGFQNGESIIYCCWSHWVCRNSSWQATGNEYIQQTLQEMQNWKQSDGMRWHLGRSERASAGLIKVDARGALAHGEVTRPQVILIRGSQNYNTHAHSLTLTHSHTPPHKPVLKDFTIREALEEWGTWIRVLHRSKETWSESWTEVGERAIS